MKKRVIIRDMTACGLPEWIRVSIGAMEQNRRFFAELRAHLGKQAASLDSHGLTRQPHEGFPCQRNER